jgi:hypothetical protein
MFFLLMLFFVVIPALVVVLVLAAGGLLGAFLGGVIGGVQAPVGKRELEACRGGCLGALAGLALTLLLLVLAWSYWGSVKH